MPRPRRSPGIGRFPRWPSPPRSGPLRSPGAVPARCGVPGSRRTPWGRAAPRRSAPDPCRLCRRSSANDGPALPHALRPAPRPPSRPSMARLPTVPALCAASSSVKLMTSRFQGSVDPVLPDRPDALQPRQDAQHPVELPPLGHRVQVRAHGHQPRAGRTAGKASDHVVRRVGGDGEAGLLELADQPGLPGQVGLGERGARHAPPLRVADLPERHQVRPQAVAVDPRNRHSRTLTLHPCPLTPHNPGPAGTGRSRPAPRPSRRR